MHWASPRASYVAAPYQTLWRRLVSTWWCGLCPVAADATQASRLPTLQSVSLTYRTVDTINYSDNGNVNDNDNDN